MVFVAGYRLTSAAKLLATRTPLVLNHSTTRVPPGKSFVSKLMLRFVSPELEHTVLLVGLVNSGTRGPAIITLPVSETTAATPRIRLSELLPAPNATLRRLPADVTFVVVQAFVSEKALAMLVVVHALVVLGHVEAGGAERALR